MADWWKNDFDLTISSYPDNLMEGAAACDRLLSEPLLPWDIERAVRHNMGWYAPILPGERIELTAPLWETHGNLYKAQFNPSIAINPIGEVRCILRTSNYTIHPDGWYIMPENDPVIRTKNFWLAPANDELKIWKGEPIEDEHLREDDGFPVQGFEDMRLIPGSGGYLNWGFSATVRDRSKGRGLCQMVYGTLDGPRVTRVHVLSRDKHEKNWMPILNHGWVYTVGPTITRDIYGCGSYQTAPHICRQFRGGSQVIPVKDTYLAVIHESHDQDVNPRRIYTHRFVSFHEWDDDRLAVERISRPFIFEKRGIEFAAGMIRLGDDLVISYGVDDARAYLVRLPLNAAMTMLEEGS